MPLLFFISAGTVRWSYLLRSCLPCSDLLQNLLEIEPMITRGNKEDLHNAIQWLKVNADSLVQWCSCSCAFLSQTFPQPPLDLITRFRCLVWGKPDTEHEEHFSPIHVVLDRRWKDWKQRTGW